jgi:hypothetical protein
MSHFTVAVICNNVSEVEKLMAPYQENNMGDCPDEFMEFNDVEEESRKEWETETKSEWYADVSHRLWKEDVEAVINKIKEDGVFTFVETNGMDFHKLIPGARVSVCGHVNDERGSENYREVFIEITDVVELFWGDIIADFGFIGLLNARRNFETNREFRDCLRRTKKKRVTGRVIDGPNEIPLKNCYPSFEEFMEDYEGHSIDERTGKYGYWENPNAKWDWYTIGGRWLGSLLIKDDADGVAGKPGAFGNEIETTPAGYKWVDVCKVSDICWEKMSEIAKFELLKNEAVDGDIWDILTGKIKIDERKKTMNYSWYKPEYFIERYGNRENYIKSSSSFGTYAVITPDGQWNSSGDMGWFGCSSESAEDKRNFDDNFHINFIEPNQDKTIVIVDCHI